MNKPIEPSNEDCCNSGCSPCIFDVYQKQLKLYNKFLETGHNLLEFMDNGISQMHYTKFKVTNVEKLCDSLKEIFFKRALTDNKKVTWECGAHFLVKYYSEKKACTRAYTPIKLRKDSDKDFDFLIVVKKYEKGLVSNYLCDLRVGEETIWRGPYCSYSFNTTYDKIIMIAQGTGIAPFISIIDSILDDDDSLTSITLFYCCENINSILFRKELYTFKSYWNFVYKIFLSGYTEENKLKYEEPVMKKKLNFEDLTDIKLCGKVQYLICGSNKFMDEYKTHLLSLNTSADNIVTF